MRKQNILRLQLLIVIAIIASPISLAFAGSNNQNGENGYQGTNKNSNQLPDQSNVPPPAGLLEDLFGAPNVVDGCRAEGGDILIHEEGLGTVYGGACCKGPFLYFDGDGNPVYEPNQCCNPPDIIYPQEMYTPGNHCLCFVMRFDPWPPALP
jgi:hypothetical protein